jgi:Spy/CpxP family protein refolding chaperone
MRNSRVVGLAIAGILAVGTIAQAQSTTTQSEQQRHATRREVRGGRGHAGLLRGITLSDAEKTQMKAIRTKYRAEAKSLRESMRPAMQDLRAARQKRDSAAVKTAWERRFVRRSRRSIRRCSTRTRSRSISGAPSGRRTGRASAMGGRDVAEIAASTRAERSRGIARGSGLGAGGAHCTNPSDREWVGGLPPTHSCVRQSQTGCAPGFSTVA